MQIGTVCGSVWATKKSDELNGLKFMITEIENRKIIAVDMVGAGVGDSVLITFGGSAHKLSGVSVDAVICGIIDKIDMEGSEKNEYK